MRLLVVFIQLIFVALAIFGADCMSAHGGPHLIAASVDGTLQIDRQGAIWIEIKNDANISRTGPDPIEEQLPDWLKGGYGINTSDAVGIDAVIQPRDARIKMLSGPQEAGSLKSKENRTLEFNAFAEGLAGPGVYPGDLVVNYRRLSDVQAMGDSEEPDVAFQYENVSETIPINIDVVKGPRISIEKVRDSLPADEESSVALIFSNVGDLPALNLRVQILPQRPFTSSSTATELGTQDPGQSAAAIFKIRVENGTAPGVYPLLFGAGYLDDKIFRNEEVAALVSVRSHREFGLTIVLAAGALTLTLVLAAVLYFAAMNRRRSGRRKKRKGW